MEEAFVDKIIDLPSISINCPFCLRMHKRECQKHRDFISKSELFANSQNLQKSPCQSYEVPVYSPQIPHIIRSIYEEPIDIPKTTHHSQSTYTRTTTVAGLLYEPHTLNTNLNYLKYALPKLEDLMFPLESEVSVDQRQQTLESVFVERPIPPPTENHASSDTDMTDVNEEGESVYNDNKSTLFTPPTYKLDDLSLDDDISWFLLNHANDVLEASDVHIFEGSALLACTELLKGLESCDFKVKLAVNNIEPKPSLSRQSLKDAIHASPPRISITYSDLKKGL